MIEVEKLKQRLSVIDQSLSEFGKERLELVQKLNEARTSNSIERFDKWNIDKDNCVIMFAKNPLEVFYLVRTFVITFDVNKTQLYCKGLLGTYEGSSSGRRYCISSDYLHFTSLEELESLYNIYVVDNVQLSIIQQHLCDLKITESNIKEYEETIAKSADRRIS